VTRNRTSAAARDRALELARVAVAQAEIGVRTSVELGAPARPVLEQLVAEGVLERAIPLIERDGTHARIAVAPRIHRRAIGVAEILEEDHRRLDRIAGELSTLGGTSAARAVVVVHLFTWGLERHFRIEEEVLLPRYELAPQLAPAAVLDVMRREHRAIAVYTRQMMDGAARIPSLVDRDAGLDDLRRAHRGLMSVLDEHNAKEEHVLFPILDRASDYAARDELVRRVLLF
jgi:hemerythrin-like domain-containing protein